MEHIILFNDNERAILLTTARNSIIQNLTGQKSVSENLQDYPLSLRQNGACFVTLHLNSQLRGCIGSLQAHQPLIVDVIQNATNAAFRDPRFPPVSMPEVAKLKLDISVLSAASDMQFSSEADLLRQLRPGIDGLILSCPGHRGTFLPSVWEQLPTPEEFLRHLKNKAGLASDYWADNISIQRYTSELIS